MKYLQLMEWRKYQHYKNRNPPWIKLHRDLLTSYTWTVLDDASRALAIACMVLASETDNKIPLDRDFIQRRGQFKKRPDLRPLIEVGFAEVVDDVQVTNDASAMLADASNLHCNPSPELEVERETEEELEGEVEGRKRPSLEEVSAYCKQRCKNIDPQRWIDYYTANGWKVGRNSMRNWKAAVRTWERNDGGFNAGLSKGDRQFQEIKRARDGAQQAIAQKLGN